MVEKEQALGNPQDLRNRLCAVARRMVDRGHNAPLDGNLSVRVSSELLLTTPSGVDKGILTPQEIVAVDPRTGEALEQGQVPSSEVRMHLEIYRQRPDIHAVVHTHSPHVVALTLAGHCMDPPVLPETWFVLGPVPTVPYASPTTSAVPDGLAPYLQGHQAFILERHGPVVLGATLEQATLGMETLAHAAHIQMLALGVGPVAPIARDELERLRALMG